MTEHELAHPLRPLLRNWVWEHGRVGTRYLDCTDGEIRSDDGKKARFATESIFYAPLGSDAPANFAVRSAQGRRVMGKSSVPVPSGVVITVSVRGAKRPAALHRRGHGAWRKGTAKALLHACPNVFCQTEAEALKTPVSG